MPDWLANLLGPDAEWFVAYVSDGRHIAFYKSFGFTLGAAFLGSLVAILFGLGGAALRRARFAPFRVIGASYANIVRGVPDVLFFLFLPLAFEQGMEWIVSTQVCGPGTVTASPWPPCTEANLFLSQTHYFLLACLTLGIVYGAFASSVIHGALNSVGKGQIEAARAFGMSDRQVLWRIQIRQMWIHALPGLSNIWMLLIKSTSLLSLLSIQDIVFWADRLGAPNFLPRVGPVHPDWRWKYYLALLVFYLVLTFVSERIFRGIRRRVSHGMIAAEA